jgi:protease-4
MIRSFLHGLGRALRGFWWLLDQSRRALANLLLLALIAAGLWLLWNRSPGALEPKTALVIGLAGPLVEQPVDRGVSDTVFGRLRGSESGQIRLRDLVAVLDAAAKDEAVPHALLMLDDFAGAGLPALREAAAALERFKAAGKKVYAWGSAYDQKQYALAAHASEVWLHPMGMVAIEGFGRYRNYYKDALDRIGVSANVVRVGRFKNAAEVFAASEPSAETLESERALYGSLWSSWTQGVERARRLPAGAIASYVDTLPQALPAAGGDTARLALQAGLVDALKTRDEMRALFVERGAEDKKGKTFRQVALGAYLARVEPRDEGDVVAVVVAQGAIGNGRAPSGRIGGLSTSELIRKAREDDEVKAIVLRVNSPGGSAFGSELIRRELELARQAGKPVVVSMGDVAASGGYWIALAADEIVADEATITGSIGVVGLLPSVRGALDRIGVHTGGTTTTWLGGAYDPRRDPDPRFVALVQSAIGRIYGDFLRLAATQRKTTPEKIDAVAQGRVWSGRQALEHGLVDRLGGFDDAVKAAAQRAKLGESPRAKLGESPRLRWMEVEPGRLQRWMRRFGVAFESALGLDLQPPLTTTALGLLPASVAGDALADLDWLREAADGRQPFAAVTHCLCAAP